MFQGKDEITQFENGKYLDAVTFHWFEIELIAMPAKIIFYLVAYYFFLKHRQNKNLSIKFNKLGNMLLKKKADRRKKEDDEPTKNRARTYFFDEDSCAESEDESYGSMFYDEDNVNEL